MLFSPRLYSGGGKEGDQSSRCELLCDFHSLPLHDGAATTLCSYGTTYQLEAKVAHMEPFEAFVQVVCPCSPRTSPILL